MFSQTTEYALRAMIWLVDHEGEPQTVRSIAAGMQAPPMYLSKVMRQLVHAGLVHGQRGKTGGFTLTKSSLKISVLDVVNAVDPIQRIRECPLHLERHKHKLCPLHTKLDQSLATMEKDFRSTCLAEMAEGALVKVGHAG